MASLRKNRVRTALSHVTTRSASERNQSTQTVHDLGDVLNLRLADRKHVLKSALLASALLTQPIEAWAVDQLSQYTATGTASVWSLNQRTLGSVWNYPAQLAVGPNNYGYTAVQFTVGVSGTYRMGVSSSSIDTGGGLYNSSFAPTSPGLNLVAGNDDNDDYGLSRVPISIPAEVTLSDCGRFGPNKCPAFEASLTSGQKYILVISHFQPTAINDFTLPIPFWCFGPGGCTFSPFVLPPSAANTRQAMSSNAGNLRGVMDSRVSNLAFMSNYDCQTFDKHGVCLSFQARYTKFDNFNEGAGVVTAAYRLTNSFRLGAFIDYRVSENAPTGIKLSNDLPTFGAFLGYSQNTNGTGLQGKALAAYQKGNATVTRMGSEDLNTEAGSGKASLNAHVLSGELGWGFALSPTLLVTPYAGIRYTDATRGNYTEGLSDNVQFPIMYNDYYQRFTTAFTGVRFAGMLSEKVGYQFGAGYEYDLQQKTSGYSGTSEISGLEAFTTPTKDFDNRARAFGSVGMSYQVDKNQRLIGNMGIRNQVYTNKAALNFMAGYQVAF